MKAGRWLGLFLSSIETGKNIAEDFLLCAFELAAKAGYASCEVVPDSIWDEASETFPW
jgi:hypothetical protein